MKKPASQSLAGIVQRVFFNMLSLRVIEQPRLAENYPCARLLTSFVRRETLRLAVDLWMMPLVALREM